MRIFIGSGQYRQIAPLVNVRHATLSSEPRMPRRANLTALSRQVSGERVPIKNRNKNTITIGAKLQSFVIDRDGAESVRRFFR